MSAWQTGSAFDNGNYLPKMTRKARTIPKIPKRPLLRNICQQTYHLGVSYLSTDAMSGVTEKKVRAIPRYNKPPIMQVKTNSQIPYVSLHSNGSAEIKNQTIAATVTPSMAKILDAWGSDARLKGSGAFHGYVPPGEKNLASKRLSSLYNKLRSSSESLSTTDSEKTSNLIQINQQLDKSVSMGNLSGDLNQNNLNSWNKPLSQSVGMNDACSMPNISSGLFQQSVIDNKTFAATTRKLRSPRPPGITAERDISNDSTSLSPICGLDSGKKLHRQLMLLQKLKSTNESLQSTAESHSLISVLSSSSGPTFVQQSKTEFTGRLPPWTEECRNCYEGAHTCRHCPRLVGRPCETCDVCTI